MNKSRTECVMSLTLNKIYNFPFAFVASIGYTRSNSVKFSENKNLTKEAPKLHFESTF